MNQDDDLDLDEDQPRTEGSRSHRWGGLRLGILAATLTYVLWGLLLLLIVPRGITAAEAVKNLALATAPAAVTFALMLGLAHALLGAVRVRSPWPYLLSGAIGPVVLTLLPQMVLGRGFSLWLLLLLIPPGMVGGWVVARRYVG